MSVKTKETSVYGFLFFPKGQSQPLARLFDFCLFLNGDRKNFSHNIETFKPSADAYWKRAQLIQTETRTKLKMYAEKIDNVS